MSTSDERRAAAGEPPTLMMRALQAFNELPAWLLLTVRLMGLVMVTVGIAVPMIFELTRAQGIWWGYWGFCVGVVTLGCCFIIPPFGFWLGERIMERLPERWSRPDRRGES